MSFMAQYLMDSTRNEVGYLYAYSGGKTYKVTHLQIKDDKVILIVGNVKNWNDGCHFSGECRTTYDFEYLVGATDNCYLPVYVLYHNGKLEESRAIIRDFYSYTIAT